MSLSIEKHADADFTAESIEKHADADFTAELVKLMNSVGVDGVDNMEQYMSRVRAEVNRLIDARAALHSSGSSYAAIIMRLGVEKHVLRVTRDNAPEIYTRLQKEKYLARNDEASSIPRAKYCYTETYFDDGRVGVGEVSECAPDKKSNMTRERGEDVYEMVFSEHEAASRSRRFALGQAEAENKAIADNPGAYDFTI